MLQRERLFFFDGENLKSTEFFYLEPGIHPSIMDIVEAINTLIQVRHNQCES